jgi:hypothetical protein
LLCVCARATVGHTQVSGTRGYIFGTENKFRFEQTSSSIRHRRHVGPLT